MDSSFELLFQIQDWRKSVIRDTWLQIERVSYTESNDSYVEKKLGILSKQCSSINLQNYFIIIGKLFLWDSGRNQIHAPCISML